MTDPGEPIPVANLAAEDYQRRVPQLGIKHFLLWTTFAAAFFAISNASKWWEARTGTAAAYQIWDLIFAIISAATATGLLTLFFNRDSKGNALRSSGHWIVFCHTISWLVFLPTRFLYDTSLRWTLIFAYLAAAACSFLVSVFAMFWNRGRWRWFFGMDATISFVQLLSYCFVFLQFVNGGEIFSILRSLNLVLMMVGCGLAAQEAVSGKSRDWIHVLGILAVFATSLSSAFWLWVSSLG